MVSSITQETFDEAVQENINDLGLPEDEAIIEAVTQFLSQGADLSKIITDPDVRASYNTVLTIVESLKEAPTVEQLTLLKQECDKGVPYKVQAGRAGSYLVLIEIIENTANKEIKIEALRAMVSLLSNQPDLMEVKGFTFIVNHLEIGGDVEEQKLVLNWVKACCVLHEMNRQSLFDAGIVVKLIALLKTENDSNLKEILTALRALILDDDVRVEFGRTHEHARLIAQDGIVLITEFLEKFKDNEIIVHDLLLTIATLLVRTEFCSKVVETKGLERIQEIMKIRQDNEKISRQCFKVLKALAGNDECKNRIVEKGLAPVIVVILDTHKTMVLTAAAGLQCAAALSLRSPENSKALFEGGLPETIVELMKLHSNNKEIQKNASWVIRNMVSRSRYQNKYFIDLGVEELLKNNLAQFKELQYDVKAALRDLNCDVDLKEEWTGHGGQITTGVDMAE